MNAIEIWQGVTPEIFRNEIRPRGQPAVLKGCVRDWPAVQLGLKSPQALCDYLKQRDTGQQVETLYGDPSIDGKFFYGRDVRTLNFERHPERMSDALDRLMAHLGDARPPAIAIQSTPIPKHLPAFGTDNVLPLLDSSIVPRIWIGNAITVAAHFDQADNFACVVAGHRRFTLFPPEQIGNLYVGPFEFTPAGTPISMVPLENPDLTRYPRFAQALEAAQSADVEPGDVVYIPFFWWHHVRSLDAFNVLVNYWWNDASEARGLPFDCLLHAMLTLRDLPDGQREIWRRVFDYYIFKTSGDPGAHLAPEQRGVLGQLNPELRNQIRTAIVRSLSRQ